MPQGKKYKVRDNKSGKVVTFQWDKSTPPGNADFEKVFSAAGLRDSTRTPFVTATASSTAQPTSPNQEKQTRPLGDVLGALTRPLGYGDPINIATTPPKQIASDVGTALEVGLPFLAAPLPPVLRIPATGALQGTGTLVKEAMMSATGERVPLMEQFKRAGESALTGMAGQAVGEGIATGVTRTLSPFGKQVNPEALAVSKRYGVEPLPSEIIDETSFGSNLMKEMEEISGKTIGGTPQVKRVRDLNFKALQVFKDDVLDNVAPETRPSVLKELVGNAIEGNENAFRRVSGGMYKKVDRATQVSPSSLSAKAFANKTLEKVGAVDRIAAKQGGADASALVRQLEQVAKLPDNISFEQASEIRSQLLATIRADRSPVGGRIKGTASVIADMLDRNMREAARRGGSNVYDLYRDASEFYRKGKQLFNSSIVAKIADKDPEELARFVFSPRSGEDISRVKEAINPTTFRNIRSNTNPETWQRFKRAGLETLIDSQVFQKVSQQTGDEFLRGANLYQALKGMGDETLSAWLNPAEKEAVMKFAKFASRVSTKEPSVGAWGISQALLATQGALAGAFMGNAEVAVISGGVIIGAPALYAKLVTSNTGRKWLTEGFRVAPGTQEAMRFASRFLAYLSSDANMQSRPQTNQEGQTTTPMQRLGLPSQGQSTLDTSAAQDRTQVRVP